MGKSFHITVVHHFTKSKKLLLLLNLALILYVPPSSGEVIWSDNFEIDSSDQWEMMGYYSALGVEIGVLESSNETVSIRNGRLQSPELVGNTNWATATRNSTTAFGSWSFDWQISENNESFDSIEFISNDATSKYNWTGLHADERGLNGYGLVLSSTDTLHPQFYPGISLVRLANGQSSGFRNYGFTSQQTGVNSIKITRTTDGVFNVFYNSVSIINWTEITYSTSEKFMYTSWIGNSSIDNIVIDDNAAQLTTSTGPTDVDSNTGPTDIDSQTEPIQKEDPLDEILVFDNNVLFAGLFSIISITGIGYLVLKPKLDSPFKLSIPITNKTTRIIKQIFGSNTKSYFVIGQNFIGKKNINEELKEEFPPEMLKHKFMMHPVRLAICKILMENTIISSADVRKKLGISWADYSNQIRSLKDNMLLIAEDRIIDGSVKQVVSITLEGIEEYNKLISILIAFIDESPMYHKYIKETKDNDNLNSN